MPIKYIPIIDELSAFILNRARSYKKNKLLKSRNIHSSVRIGINCLIDKNVFIGKGTYLGAGCQLYSGNFSRVDIGDYCAIGYNVHIKSRTHDLAKPTADKFGSNKRKEQDIFIGDNVWIGDHVFIKEGITIGSNAIIGANSVVVNDVKEREIVGGVPARHIKFNTLLKK
jgi:maltose O-acetyltransferase